MLTQGIWTIFIDQSPTFHVLKKVHTILAPKYSSTPPPPPSLKILMNKAAQFEAALKMYLNTCSFYSVEEFLMFKNNSCVQVSVFI
jgi:hypothetical protein